MVFTSSTFIFIFLPMTCLVYLLASLTRNTRIKNLVLLAYSMLFYAWSGVKYALLLCLSIVVNYLLGLWMKNKSEDKEKRRCSRKTIITIGVVWNIGILFWFKYMNFFIPSLNIVLPIGISFFTFQILSYLFDVYYGTVPVQKNVGDLALYVMLFPQLIAGPIVRYKDVSREINCRHTDSGMLHDGIIRFMMGFSKKIFLANSMGAVADRAFSHITDLSTGYAWLGLLSYALQIYMDFSAYSDMAIGLGSIFGFNFLENFNYPYISKSVKEFWRRWHISLSTWFRDYVYIPMGGNRRGETRTYVNLFTVFILTGIWHGASWNFLLWGLYYGVFLVVERAFLGDVLKKIPRLLNHIYTLLVVLVGWVLFRAETLSEAVLYAGRLFSFDFSTRPCIYVTEKIDNEYICMLIVAIIVSTPVIRIIITRIKDNKLLSLLMDIVIIGLFLLAVLYMVGADFNPFIYFRF